MKQIVIGVAHACVGLLAACAGGKGAPVSPETTAAPVDTTAPAKAAKAQDAPAVQCRRLAIQLDLSAKSKLAIVSDAGWVPHFACVVSSPAEDGVSLQTLLIVDSRTGKSVLDEEHSSGTEQDGRFRKSSVKVTPFALGPTLVGIRIAVETRAGAADGDNTKKVVERIGRVIGDKFVGLITLESKFDYGETTDSTVEEIAATKVVHRGYFELRKTTTERDQEYGGEFKTKVTTSVERLRWDGSAYDAEDVPER